MDPTDCSTDCEELGEVPYGEQLVVAADTDEGGDIAFENCEFALIPEEGVQLPAIPVQTSGVLKWKDGSSAFPIEVPLETSDVISPLIQDEAGVIKNYKPAPVLGKKRLIVKDGRFVIVPFTFPGLVDPTLDVTGAPDFYLGANKITKICDPVDSGTPIQLLKIAYAVPVLPVANDDEIEVEFETMLSFSPMSNDSGVGIEITSVSNPPNGSAVIVGGTTIEYTPDNGYDGPDSFTYTITDDNAETDIGTVTVNVLPGGEAAAETCADDCSILDENRPLTAIDAAEIWIDTICQILTGGTPIDSFEDGGSYNNDVASTGASRPTFDTVGGNGILFNESDDEYLLKSTFGMFNSGSATAGMMLAVVTVDGSFAGTRIPIACWGPPGAPLMSIEFNFSGSWLLTGKINGQTRSIAFDPVGKTFVVSVGNQINFGAGTASYITVSELSGGSVIFSGTTHSPGSATFAAGQTGDLYIGGHDATDTGSFKLHEFFIMSKPHAFGFTSGDPDPACYAAKWT